MNKITFDLHILGWKAFEDLVFCVFGDVLGHTLQIFAEGKDGGRDAAFKGVWNSGGPPTSFCIQCKHTSKPTKILASHIVDGELSNVSKLSKAGLCDTYIFVTNYSVPAEVAAREEKKIVSAGAKHAFVYGAEWLDQTISLNPKLRRLVPRIYGLGDLTQIITHQAYTQARQVLDSIAPDLNCFVPTAAYRKCAHALQEHGFVLLLGEPASGKTMIANLMALSAADEWNLQTLIISEPADITRLWNPNDTKQFLWIDDAFGATQYEASRVGEWNQQLVKLKAAIKNGARVVLTSRDYIFAAAKKDLKISSFELFDDSRVLIEVEKLTQSEREMILYNHLKTGSQPQNFKTQVKTFLGDASQVPKFLPEISRRFANPKFTGNLVLTKDGVRDFFDRPVKVLQDVISELAPAERAALGFVFMGAGKLAIPLTATESVNNVLNLLNVTLGEVKSALVGLDDSLLKRITESSTQYWVFRHPTIRDSYASIVGANPELIDVYLAGVTTARLLNEVSCGAPSIQGVKIIVPADRYHIIIDRLNKYSPPPGFWGNEKSIFLNTRCSEIFLREYFKQGKLSEYIPTRISVYQNEFPLMGKLRTFGILPENIRKPLAKSIIDLCERDRCCESLMSRAFRQILTDIEFETSVAKITDEVLSDGEWIIDTLKDEWDEECEPSEVFSKLKDTLRFIEYGDQFSNEQKTEARYLGDLIGNIETEMQSKYKDEPYQRLDAETAVELIKYKTKSIFDDVDE